MSRLTKKEQVFPYNKIILLVTVKQFDNYEKFYLKKYGKNLYTYPHHRRLTELGIRNLPFKGLALAMNEHKDFKTIDLRRLKNDYSKWIEKANTATN